MQPDQMPPEPAAILGFLLGVLLTLFIQAYGRRKARQAAAAGTATTPAAIDAERSVHLLVRENERQAAQVLRLEERLANLERIATDPAERTHRAIEALR